MIKNHLETFVQNFPLTRAMAYEDYIVYRVGKGLANKGADDANKIIDSLGLPLTAYPTKFTSNDSFVVQMGDVEL